MSVCRKNIQASPEPFTIINGNSDRFFKQKVAKNGEELNEFLKQIGEQLIQNPQLKEHIGYAIRNFKKGPVARETTLHHNRFKIVACVFTTKLFCIPISSPSKVFAGGSRITQRLTLEKEIVFSSPKVI